MRIALVSAPLRSAICDLALGHQTPLGLLMIAGPLLDEGHEVILIDAARDHLTDDQIAHRLKDYQAEIVMTGHSASTKSHPGCLRLLRHLKAALPKIVTVYGGVHPTYHCRAILFENKGIDIIVCGEGEGVAPELIGALAESPDIKSGHRSSDSLGDLSRIAGIAWRSNGVIVVNEPRPPIGKLDNCRIAWELIDDWDKYRAFGLGRTAVVQFSRGCPHRCTYCGQWAFWSRWRHRDASKFVDELEFLHRRHGIRFFWFADENPTSDKKIWRSLLEEIVRRNMDVNMTASIIAKDIVRDADIMDLYRQAGFLYVLMGVETTHDGTLHNLRKISSVDDAIQAVRLLRKQGILSIIDYIFGFENETPRTICKALKGLNHYDSDFVNVLHLTPYAWTDAADEWRNRTVVDADLNRWDYRHQVLNVSGLTPMQLFMGAKLVEMLYHIHPKRLWRAISTTKPELRRQYRFSYLRGTRVFLHEIFEFLRNSIEKPANRS